MPRKKNAQRDHPKFYSVDSLCWECSRSPWCRWFQGIDGTGEGREPPDGAKAMLIANNQKQLQQSIHEFLIKIVECPQFEK